MIGNTYILDGLTANVFVKSFPNTVMEKPIAVNSH
jgi:hypothetical protein